MLPSAPGRRAALASLAGLVPFSAGAQSGAGRTVHPAELIVPAAPGGPLGATAAILAEALGRRGRPPVSLQHMSGAVAGALAVARSPADGSRLGLASPSLCINAALRDTLPYSTLSDLAPVCQLGDYEFGIFANAALPVRNMAELLAWARSARAPLRYASPGLGTGSHLAAESFAYEAGLKMEHTPFANNAAAEKAVATGQLPLFFNGLSSTVAEARKGPLRLVALMGKRSLDGISTVSRVLPGFEFTGTLGLIAPRAVPGAVVRRLAQDIGALVAQPDIRQRLADVGLQAVASSPEDYDAHLRADIARWRLVGRVTQVRLR